MTAFAHPRLIRGKLEAGLQAQEKKIMNWSLFKKVLLQVAACGSLVILAGAVAMAQDNAAASAQAPGARSDGQIEMDVVHALDASKALQNDMITAATIQNEVTLAGTVASEASRELAESIAGSVPGVTKVNNNLKVGNPQAEAGGQPPAESQPEDDSDQPAQAQDNQPYPVQDQPQNQAQDDQPYPAQDQVPQPAPARRQYVPAQPPVQAYEAPKGPVTVPSGTLLQLRTSEPVNSKRAKDGEPVQFLLIHDVNLGGVLAIPRGATVHGVVTEVKNTQSGDLGGSAKLTLQLTSLELGGQNYPLNSDQFVVRGPNKAGRTVNSALSGGILGTIIGCAAGRGAGCAIGAGAGVAAGTAASAASSGPGVWIPSEALVDFHLTAALTVKPVSTQEAARLAQGLYPGGPALYRRDGPYGSPYYAYPPVYFHPYYAVGGGYYWR
jgi:hypothetical protein